jgi:myo-inositol 2-dehydrogenase/D-chiro-inositol 1-dehydrogenase
MSASAVQHKVVKVCLCGGGRIGTVHLRDLLGSHRVKLTAIVEVVEKRRLEMVSQAGCKGYATLDDAMADKENQFDAVLICTPTGSHHELVLKALNANYPVFCEKPISLDINAVDECYNLAKQKNQILLCAYQRRFDPSFVKLQKAVQSGELGKVHVIKTTSRDHPLPSFEFLKTSGGIYHDCGSHDIDVVRWVLGEEPVEVYSTAHAFLGPIKEMNDYDTVVMILKFPSGATAMIDLDRTSAYGYDQRIEVSAEKGMIQAENKSATTVVTSTAGGVARDKISHTFTDRYDDAYRLELEHFVDLVLGIETQPKLTHEDVRRVSLIADACHKSAQTGAPVKLNLV